MPAASHSGCAYGEVEVCRKRKCKAAGKCPAGFVVFRDQNGTGGGHHHVS